ncbi:YfhO family protein [candidate division WOR-3 bacterium]|nr:YfhO family protein [candidate division WOR-3 bacterium]
MNKKKFHQSENIKAIVILFLLNIIYFLPIIMKKGYLWEDFLYQNYPYRLFAAVNLRNGIFPFWNPYVFGGIPFFADVQASILYPFNLLLSLFVRNNFLSYYVVQFLPIFHIFLAGVFMFLLLKNLKLKWESSLIGAIIYMFNFRFILHLTHLNRILTFAWFPLIFLLYKKGIDNLDLKFIIGAGLTIGIVAFAGYPQALIIEMLILFYYFIYRLVIDRKQWKRIMLFSLLVMGIGIGIAAFQYLPTAHLMKSSIRADYTYEQIVLDSYNPGRFLTFLVPNLFGTAARGIISYFGPGHSYFFWEQTTYIGIFALFFAFLSYHRERKSFWIFLLISALFSLSISMGRYFFTHRILYFSIPIFKMMRTPPIHMNSLVFLATIMAALGFDRFLLREKQIKNKFLIGIVVFSIILALILYQYIPSEIQKSARVIVSNCIWRFLLLAVAFAVIVGLYTRKKMSRWQFALLIGIGIFIDLFFTGAFYNAGRFSPHRFWAKSGFVSYIQASQESELTRLAQRTPEGHLRLRRNVGSVFRIFVTDGYNPMQLKRYVHIRRDLRPLNLNNWYRIDNVRYAAYLDKNNLGVREIKNCLPRAKLFFDFTIIKDADEAIRVIATEEFDPDKTVILEESPKIPISYPGEGRLSIDKYTPNRIEISVESRDNAILFLSENYYDRWIATIDGERTEITPCNVTFRAISVPKGKHKIVFQYKEILFYPLLGISLSLILISFFLVIYLHRKQK